MMFKRFLSGSILAAACCSAFAQDAKVLELGQLTYQTCATCHGPDGKGVVAQGVSMAPNLLESPFIKGEHYDLIAAVVLKGIEKQDNKYVQMMLPLETVLNDEQVAAVVTHVATQFGGKKHTVKPAEVAQWRQQFADQKKPYRRADLADLLKAATAPALLSHVTYRFYTGQWKKLPDFSQLQPESTGELKNGRISLDPAKGFKHPFGMTFEAKLTVPRTEEYEFTLTSDDGAILAIDGEGVIDLDGIHPAQTKSAKEKLEAGEHTLKVLYFDGGGQRNLALAAKTKSFGELALSTEKVSRGGGGQSYDPIVLQPVKPGEAIVHRAFLPNAKPRAIGIGYPGAVNVCWDADVLNLAYIWRGEFMDASPHWNNRGSGSRPLGQDMVKIAHGLPFQVLTSLTDPWQPFSEAKIKYERDNANPQKEITFTVRHPDYRFRGYRLDARRFPTFQYDYQAMKVTDAFAPQDIDGVMSLVRTLTVSGKAAENTYFRLADSGPLSAQDGWYDAGNNLRLKVEGPQPTVREVSGKKELLAPISGEGSLVVTYRWNTPLAAH